MPILLFVYGTLHPDRAPREIAHAARRLTLVGPATIRGHLYHLGAYPGVVLASHHDPAQPEVPGHLFHVPDAATLAALDAYEGFRPADPAASLFLRVEAPATTPHGAIHSCQVYVYNGRLPADSVAP